MKRAFTIEDLKKSKVWELNRDKVEDKLPEKGKSKYGNSKTAVGEIVFDSKREAKRWKELRMLLKAGKIGMLARQVEFELNPGGTHSVIYKADFTYVDTQTGEKITEDVKGMRTREYLKKKRLMKKLYGITITEI